MLGLQMTVYVIFVKGSNSVNYSYIVLMRFTFELRKEEEKKGKGQKILEQNRLSRHQSSSAQTSKRTRHCLVQQGLARYNIVDPYYRGDVWPI